MISKSVRIISVTHSGIRRLYDKRSGGATRVFSVETNSNIIRGRSLLLSKSVKPQLNSVTFNDL